MKCLHIYTDNWMKPFVIQAHKNIPFFSMKWFLINFKIYSLLAFFFFTIRMSFMLEPSAELLSTKSQLMMSTQYPLKQGQLESFQKCSCYLPPTAVLICRVSALWAVSEDAFEILGDERRDWLIIYKIKVDKQTLLSAREGLCSLCAYHLWGVDRNKEQEKHSGL